MIKELFEKGQQQLLDKAAKEESTKVGTLRAGNSSLLLPSGEFVGVCPNVTYLRFKGIVIEPVDKSRDLMFDAGRRNEDHWVDVLKQSWDGIVLTESEVPIRWETTNGTQVTGRPDIVLCDKDKNPVCGIELKLVSSLWTARDVYFQKKPKLNHLVQAAHYSWKLNVPFELWYTSRADFAITGDWVKNLFPKPGELGSEHCVYAYYQEGKLNPKTGKNVKHKLTKMEYDLKSAMGERGLSCDILKINPFTQGYLTDIHNGKLYYKDAMLSNSSWIETLITLDDITRYYERITEMETLNQVQPTPKLLDVNGDKLNYTAQQYCSLGDLCCGKCPEKQLDKWVDKIKLKLEDK